MGAPQGAWCDKAGEHRSPFTTIGEGQAVGAPQGAWCDKAEEHGSPFINIGEGQAVMKYFKHTEYA